MSIEEGKFVFIPRGIEVPERIQILQDQQKILYVGSTEDMNSGLADASPYNNIEVFIKYIGCVYNKYFQECDKYTIIIQTENAWNTGGDYHKYDDVVSHQEEEYGVRLITGSGEYFHPWSFDGGIRCIVK